jgi:hypothetical protein
MICTTGQRIICTASQPSQLYANALKGANVIFASSSLIIGIKTAKAFHHQHRLK